MKHLTWILPLLAALAIAACDESADPAAPVTGPDISSIPFEPGVFPNTIGTIWVYRVAYPGSNSYDTVQVRVTDTLRTHDGHLASVWTLITNNRLMQAQYVAAFGDTVMFYWTQWPTRPVQRPDLMPARFFLFPSPTGRAWRGPYGDSTVATAGLSLDVPAGHYDDVTLFNSINGSPSGFWLKPRVGLIKMTDPRYNFYMPDEEWTLMRFTP